MTTTEAEDLKEKFHLRREAARRAVTPVTETEIMDEMGTLAWSFDN